jgi:hypothetical protein
MIIITEVGLKQVYMLSFQEIDNINLMKTTCVTIVKINVYSEIKSFVR